MLNQSIISVNQLNKSICIKNSNLKSENISKYKTNTMQMIRIVTELSLMCLGFVDLRKYDGL